VKELRAYPSTIAWVIECQPGLLIGPLWFMREGSDQGQLSGYRSAAFRTRDAARLALKLVKGPADRGLYPKARIQRVLVYLIQAEPQHTIGVFAPGA